MPTTPNGLPYPDYTAAPDVPFDVQQLAEALDPMAGDTGWLALTLRPGYATQGSDPIDYRRRGGLVYIRWGLSTAGVTLGPQVIGSLPAGFRPSRSCYFNAVGDPDDQVKARWVIMADGDVTLHPIGTPSGGYYLFPGQSSWLAEA